MATVQETATDQFVAREAVEEGCGVEKVVAIVVFLEQVFPDVVLKESFHVVCHWRRSA